MGYQVRTRDDGQFEIVKVIVDLIGVFPRKTDAARICAMLGEADAFGSAAAGGGAPAAPSPAVPPPPAAMPGEGRAEPGAGTGDDAPRPPAAPLLAAVPTPAPAPAALPVPAGASGGGARSEPSGKAAVLAAVIRENPVVPWVRPASEAMDDISRDGAFRRLAEGESVVTVARSLGLSAAVLRGAWAAETRRLARWMREGGQEACAMCRRPFVTSVTNPDTCARCSRG